jgi:hypothetical protein
MLRNLSIVLVSLSLGFCSVKKDQPSSGLKNHSCLLKEIFTSNQIQFLLEQDPIDYLARLSQAELRSFDPENQITNLELLSRDVRDVFIQNYPDKRDFLIENDRLIFNKLSERKNQWVHYRNIEISIRGGRELLGIEKDIVLSQSLIRPWVEAKLRTFNPIQALYRYLPSNELKEHLLRENPILNNFIKNLNRSITDRTDLDKVRTWMRSAQIWGGPEQFNQAIELFLRGHAHEDTVDSIIKVFLASKIEIFNNLDDITRVNIISEQLASYLERIRLTFRGQENSLESLAHEVHNTLIQAGTLPSSFRNVSEEYSLDFYLDLFIRDFFAAPVEDLARHSPDMAQIFENSNRLLAHPTATPAIDDMKLDFEVPDMDLDI